MAETDQLDEMSPREMAVQLVSSAPFSMVLTDPGRPDNPIVFVNDAFERATGYSRAESVGRNCRFLQGPGTDPRTVARIGDAVRRGAEITTDILNYRADGRPFWNRLLIAPLRSEDGSQRFCVGVQKVLGALEGDEVPGNADLVLREIQHRVKNHLQMIVSMIQLQSRSADSQGSLDDLARRVQGLQLLYEELNDRDGENSSAVALASYLDRVARSVMQLDTAGVVALELDTETFAVPLEVAVRAGMIVSEAVTNAVKHGFPGRGGGTVRLAVRETDDRTIAISVADDGAGLPPGATWPDQATLGGRLILQLARSMNAEITLDTGPAGTTIAVLVPSAARDRF